MIRVNLLPHREARRKRARQYFFVLSGATLVAGLVVWGVVHGINQQRVSTQNQRNAFLKTEIAALDKQIDEIKKLKDEIAALLARKQVIEALQTDRAQTVYLLDQLVKQMPEGVYLKSMVQKGPKVSLNGYAQSNARVSTLMRNIESSQWLEKPELVEIKSATVDKRRVSEFNLNLSLKRPKPAAATKDAATAGAKGAATPATKVDAAKKG
jgi:type IV pilus assembly protein PilN